jgi:hypothetical protein
MSTDGVWIGHAWQYEDDFPDPPVPLTIMYTENPDGSELDYLFGVTDSDPDHTVRWTWGDGTTSQAKAGDECPHSFPEAGEYNVRARCHGETATTVVVAEDPPPPLILINVSPYNNDWWTKDTCTLTLIGTGLTASCVGKVRSPKETGPEVICDWDLTGTEGILSGLLVIPAGYFPGNDECEVWLEDMARTSESQISNKLIFLATTETITNQARKFTLQLENIRGNYHYRIRWGNGQNGDFNTNSVGNATLVYTYPQAGNFTIEVRDGQNDAIVYQFPITAPSGVAANGGPESEGWTPE